jgi:hypothetical protein
LSTEDEDTETGIVNALPNGDVQIRFAGMQPFDLPQRTAIQFAALLASRAGCKISFKPGSMKIRFPRGFDFSKEEKLAPIALN